jgi:hypothetical protein
MQPHACPVPAYLPVPIAAKHLTSALCAVSVTSWLLTLYHVCHVRQSTNSAKPVQIFIRAPPAIAASTYIIQPLAFPVLQLMQNAVAVVQ